MPPEPSQKFREHDETGQSLQDLVEAEAGPQSEVGPEVVEGALEAELVHRGHLHSHVRVEVEAELSGGVLMGRHLPLDPSLNFQTRPLRG